MFTRCFRFIGRVVSAGPPNGNGPRGIGATGRNHPEGRRTPVSAPELQDATAAGSEAVALTGRWTGQYFCHGQGHQITADIMHEEKRITGTMCDEEPDFEEPL